MPASMPSTLVTLTDNPPLATAIAGTLTAVHFGAADATTQQLLVHVRAAVDAGPSAMVVHLGTSDLFKKTALTTFEMGLKLLAKSLAPLGKQVLLSTVLDYSHAPVLSTLESFFGITPALFVRRLEEMNDRLKLISRRSGFQLIDLCATTRPELFAHPEYFLPDGLHLSPAGIARLVSDFEAPIRALG
jgi:lysophospholipase L1-like esterase